MTRRSFLTRLAVVSGAIITSEYLRWRYLGSGRLPLSCPPVLSSFCDEETMRKIGFAYLALVPAENSTAALLAGLSQGIDSARDDFSNFADLARAAETKAENDFRA